MPSIHSRPLWFSRFVGLVLLCFALLYAVFPQIPKEVTLGLIASGTTLILGVNAILAKEERHKNASHSVLSLLQPLVPPLLSLLRHLNPAAFDPTLATPPFSPPQTSVPAPTGEDSPTEPSMQPFSPPDLPAHSNAITDLPECTATIALGGDDPLPMALPTHAQIQVKPAGMPARFHLATPPPTNV